MEEQPKLKVGDKIVCIKETDHLTIGKDYKVIEINENECTYTVIEDDGIKSDYTLVNFDKYFKLKEKTSLKKGDVVICISDKFSYFTKGKEYKVLGSSYTYFETTDDFGEILQINDLHYGADFKLKEETKTAYKETNGKLFYELDFDFITQIAERMASNKGKYEPYNWQKLDNIEELKQALFRHVLEVMKGNLEDDGRDFGHLEAIACDVMMIYYQLKKNRQKITK